MKCWSCGVSQAETALEQLSFRQRRNTGSDVDDRISSDSLGHVYWLNYNDVQFQVQSTSISRVNVGVSVMLNGTTPTKDDP